MRTRTSGRMARLLPPTSRPSTGTPAASCVSAMTGPTHRAAPSPTSVTGVIRFVSGRILGERARAAGSRAAAVRAQYPTIQSAPTHQAPPTCSGETVSSRATVPATVETAATSRYITGLLGVRAVLAGPASAPAVAPRMTTAAIVRIWVAVGRASRSRYGPSNRAQNRSEALSAKIAASMVAPWGRFCGRLPALPGRRGDTRVPTAEPTPGRHHRRGDLRAQRLAPVLGPVARPVPRAARPADGHPDADDGRRRHPRRDSRGTGGPGQDGPDTQQARDVPAGRCRLDRRRYCRARAHGLARASRRRLVGRRALDRRVLRPDGSRPRPGRASPLAQDPTGVIRFVSGRI